LRFVGAVQDVTAGRLVDRELQAHYAVSQALRQWGTFEEGVMDLLRRLGTALHYPMGSVWRWDDEAGGLVCRAFWHSPDIDPLGFEQAKRRLVFKPGEGKPGVAWKSREPVVTSDAAADPIFQPRAAAIDRGVRSGIAFPAMGSEGPIAVVSFYGFEQRVPSSSFVRTLSAIGDELGRFLERRRSELGPQPLSKREVEVMRLAASGLSGPQIAEHLVLSPSTIKTHFEHIYEKLGVSDRAAAVALALRTGVIR
jgi:DNA-binding CsgD family transcriptional regulator